MTDGTTLGRTFFFLSLEKSGNERRATFFDVVEPDYIDMLVMRKADTEFGNKLSSLQLGIRNIAETWENPPGRVAGTNCDMTVRANRGRGPLAREELGPMTIQARSVLRKIAGIRKCRVAFTKFFPVRRRNFVTRVTGKLLRNSMRGVRKLCVINFWFWWDFRFLRSGFLRPSLRAGCFGRANKTGAQNDSQGD